jgi:hypothetical protein
MPRAALEFPCALSLFESVGGETLRTWFTVCAGYGYIFGVNQDSNAHKNELPKAPPSRDAQAERPSMCVYVLDQDGTVLCG